MTSPPSEADLAAHFDAAVELWRRRAELLPDCDVTPDCRAKLGGIEVEYAEHVATLAAHDPQHPAVREAWLRGGEGIARQVATHVLLSSRQTPLWETLITSASQRDDGNARVVAAMLRFCSDEVVVAVARRMLELDRPWLRRALAGVLGTRGVVELAPLLRAGLPRRSGQRLDLELVDALALLGDVAAGDQLLEWLQLLNSDERDRWQVASVRALCLIGHPRAVELCEALIRDETTAPEDLPSRYARVAGSAAADLLIERLETSEEPAWREALAAALGVVGTVRAVDALLAALGEDDDDVRAAADRALSQLFGIDAEDPDEPFAWWSDWWGTHAGDFDPSIRYSQGQPISIERELAWLEHPIADDRELALEYLILATGQHIAFDPRALVQDRVAGITRWREWIAANADRLAPGTWWTHSA